MQKRVKVFCKLVICWVIKGFSQPRIQAIVRYLSYEKRLGTERDSARPSKKLPHQREKGADNFSRKIICFLRQSRNISDVSPSILASVLSNRNEM